MGADMIGYLLVGPKSIASKRDEAIEQVTSELALVKDIEQTLIDGKLLTKEQIDHLESNSVDADYPEHIQSIYTDVLTGIESPEKYVDELIEFWDGNAYARDTASRYYGDKQIVFAGGATWGDDPDGYGYIMLKRLTMFNLEPVLGIE